MARALNPMPGDVRDRLEAAGSMAATVDGFASTDGVVVATMADTGGCSSTQIIADARLGNGHSRFGISRSALQAWIDSLQP